MASLAASAAASADADGLFMLVIVELPGRQLLLIVQGHRSVGASMAACHQDGTERTCAQHRHPARLALDSPRVKFYQGKWLMK